MKTISCQHCGSVYEETKITLPMTDKDDYSCDVCGEILKEWKGTYMFTFNLIERKEKPNTPIENY